MERLTLAATLSSPFVDLDPDSGFLVIRGESYPENAFAFFAPVIRGLEELLAVRPPRVELEVALTYLNTSSIKAVMDILDLLEAAHARGDEAVVRWYYDQENDRSLELAEEFKEDFAMPFHIVAR